MEDDGEGDKKVIRNAADANELSEQMFEYLFETVLLEPCFKVHRIAKTANAVLPPPVDPQSEPVVVGDYDIFGSTLISQTKHQKNMDVVCDECKRTIAASRFAPHLEKCMGMGRNSSRVARRRINQTINYTNSLKNSFSTGRLRESCGRDSDLDHSDEDSRHTIADDDDDWASSRRSRKSRKTKSRSRTKPEFC